jgi:hypothetical protein
MRLPTVILCVLLAAFPIDCVLADDSAEKQPYLAKAVVEYLGAEPGVDPTEVLMSNLPRGEFSASVREIRNTNLYEITVSAADPKQAVKRVTQIVAALQNLINDPEALQPRLKIWEKGELVEKSGNSGSSH